MNPLSGKRILVVGGTGSLGQALVRRLLGGDLGQPARIVVFSRDEAKQHQMRLAYQQGARATDEIIYQNFQRALQFRIGDVRDEHQITAALRDVEIVFNAAALKQVPTCEYFPHEAVRTNVGGMENIVRAIELFKTPVETVVGISTDKACKPVNVMGMTKALQERVLVQANLRCPETRFICVRYGNVLASRGSVIPLFQDQIRNGGPVTITTAEMTRFVLDLDEAVDAVFAAVREAAAGETYVPLLRAARIAEIAKLMIAGRRVETVMTGIRPGEKLHEVLVSAEEAFRTVRRGGYYAIRPMLPELVRDAPAEPSIGQEFSSADSVMTYAELARTLAERGLLEDGGPAEARP